MKSTQLTVLVRQWSCLQKNARVLNHTYTTARSQPRMQFQGPRKSLQEPLTSFIRSKLTLIFIYSVPETAKHVTEIVTYK